MSEFDEAVNQLVQSNIDVIVHQGDPDDNRPNAVFPNNWISTWPNGNLFLYPMAADSRRHERDKKILEQISEKFVVQQTIDLSHYEMSDQYLESTGVIVFDHLERIAYGCLSSRCDERLFIDHIESLGYQPIAFRAYDQTGVAIYHTNVMMGIQSTTAVICSEAITDQTERSRVLELLGLRRQIIDISFEQMGAFCGNVLEVESKFGKKMLVLSQSAFDAYDENQLEVLSTDKSLIPIDIPTIEEAGGGSARCMLAEIFLPNK